MVWQSIFDVASSLWLVVDMALDCVTIAGFYSKGAAEFPFFVASIVALFFPTLIPIFTGRRIFSLLAGRDDLEVVRATIGGASSDLDQRHIP